MAYVTDNTSAKHDLQEFDPTLLHLLSYDEETLTIAQKEQARNNIDVPSNDIAVRAVEGQTFTALQKGYVRDNINALGKDDNAVGIDGSIITTGLSPVQYSGSPRTSIISGGYCSLGGLVQVQIRIRPLQTLQTDDYRYVVNGFPVPRNTTPVALSAAPVNENGSIRMAAHINGQGTLSINPTEDMSAGASNDFVVTGTYFKVVEA